MKKTSTCPKCQGTEIYTDQGQMKRGDRSTIGVASWTQIMVATYVCASCGYIEEYAESDFLNDSSKMEKLAKNWRKLG